jgi:hypothetical protein
MKIKTLGNLVIIGLLPLRGVWPRKCLLNYPRMLSLLVLPLPMLDAGCDTLLPHQLMLKKLCSLEQPRPVVSPHAN